MRTRITPDSGASMALRRRTLSLTVALFLVSCITSTAFAQEPAPTSGDSEAVKQLLKRVEQLEARIKELEDKQRQPSMSVTTASPSTTTAEREGSTQDSAAISSSHEKHIGATPLLQIRGFGDVGFHATDQKGEKQSFGLGQLDLFLTSRLSERLSVLGELVLEAGDDNEFGFEVERLLLQYKPSDYFNVAFGRYHTSIGYYNSAYHHGTWFQTAVGRPFIFEFEDEGGILPIHNVGVAANGRIPSGKLGLQYVAEIGNGRAARSPLDEPVLTVADENNGKAVNFGLLARPETVPGLQAGFSIYRDRLTPDGSPTIGETILAAHLVYQNSAFEFLNEGLLIRHSPRGPIPRFHTPGFYTQISRRFDKARPFFRYQYINVPDGEPIFGDVGRINGPSLGLRYDVSEFAAFKAQYDRTARRHFNAFNGLSLQLAFTF